MLGMLYRRGRTYVYPTPKRLRWFITLLIATLFLVAIPVLTFIQEGNVGRLLGGFEVVEQNLVDARKAQQRGEVVYLEGSSYKGTVADGDFGFQVEHAINLERRVEYCQWTEIASTIDVKCEESPEYASYEDCISTTRFSYMKSWSPIRVNSLLFDQPAAHHNPQRDPFPSMQFTSADTVAFAQTSTEEFPGMKFHLLPSLLSNAKAPSRPLAFTIGAQRSRVKGLWNRFTKWLGVRDSARYEDISSLAGTVNYPAAAKGFTFVGQGGYFYSPFEDTASAKLTKAFFQHLEGSLLDWQFSDLMPSCTAGDIRVRYYVQDPEVISAVGMITDIDTTDIGMKTAEMFTTTTVQGIKEAYLGNVPISSGKEVGIVHAGSKDPKSLLRDEAENGYLLRFIARALLVPWALLLSKFIGAILGRELRPGRGASMRCALFATMCTWSAAMLIIRMWHWHLFFRQSKAAHEPLSLEYRAVNEAFVLLLSFAFAFRHVALYAPRSNQKGLGSAFGLIKEMSGFSSPLGRAGYQEVPGLSPVEQSSETPQRRIRKKHN